MEVLADFARHGVRFQIDGDGSLRTFGMPLTDDLRARIRAQKGEIVGALRSRRYATAAETRELRRLLDVILKDCPEELEESLALACADPDGALMSLRALVADMQGAA